MVSPHYLNQSTRNRKLDALGKEIIKFPGTSFVFFKNTFGTAGIKNALYLSKIVKDSI